MARAEGAMWGDEMNSALRVRAKSEGGRKARNEILIVSFLNPKSIYEQTKIFSLCSQEHRR